MDRLRTSLYSIITVHLKIGGSKPQWLFLRDAIRDYWEIREYEEALYLPPTFVPKELIPHLQNFSQSDDLLLEEVNRLAAYPSTDLAGAKGQQEKPVQPLPASDAQIDARSKAIWVDYVFTHLYDKPIGSWRRGFYGQCIQMEVISPSLTYEKWLEQEGWKSLSFETVWEIYKKLIDGVYRQDKSSEFDDKEQGFVYEHFSQRFRVLEGNLYVLPDNLRRKKRDNLRITLHLWVNELDKHKVNHFYLQEAVLDYLWIREFEEELHLPATPVPEVLIPYFYYITNPNLQTLVNRLAVYPSSTAPVITQLPPVQPLPASTAQLDATSKAIWLDAIRKRYESSDERAKEYFYDEWIRMEVISPSLTYEKWLEQEGWRSLSFETAWNIEKNLRYIQLYRWRKYPGRPSDFDDCLYSILNNYHRLDRLPTKPPDNQTRKNMDFRRITLHLWVNELDTQKINYCNCSGLLFARAYAKAGMECPPLEDLSSLINPGGDHHDRAVHRQLRPQERCILCPETSERPLYSDRHTAAILLDARSRLRIFPLCTYVRGFS